MCRESPESYLFILRQLGWAWVSTHNAGDTRDVFDPWQEDLYRNGNPTLSIPWKIPCSEEPGGCSSQGCKELEWKWAHTIAEIQTQRERAWASSLMMHAVVKWLKSIIEDRSSRSLLTFGRLSHFFFSHLTAPRTLSKMGAITLC